MSPPLGQRSPASLRGPSFFFFFFFFSFELGPRRRVPRFSGRRWRLCSVARCRRLDVPDEGVFPLCGFFRSRQPLVLGGPLPRDLLLTGFETHFPPKKAGPCSHAFLFHRDRVPNGSFRFPHPPGGWSSPTRTRFTWCLSRPVFVERLQRFGWPLARGTSSPFSQDFSWLPGDFVGAPRFDESTFFFLMFLFFCEVP